MPRTPAADVTARKISAGDEAPEMSIVVVGGRDDDEAIYSEGRTWRKTREKAKRAETGKTSVIFRERSNIYEDARSGRAWRKTCAGSSGVEEDTQKVQYARMRTQNRIYTGNELAAP